MTKAKIRKNRIYILNIQKLKTLNSKKVEREGLLKKQNNFLKYLILKATQVYTYIFEKIYVYMYYYI